MDLALEECSCRRKLASSDLSPLASCIFMCFERAKELIVTQIGKIGHTAASFFVGGAFSSSTCARQPPLSLAHILYPCTFIYTKWTVYVRILCILHYEVLVGWLVRGLRQEGGLLQPKSELWPRVCSCF